MALAYLLACLPAVVGAVLWATSTKVAWWEWLLGTAVSFLCVAIFHAVVIFEMTADVETWSGRIVKSVHYPYWHADWYETETYTVTVGSGKNAHHETRTRVVHRTMDYPPHWQCEVNYGERRETYDIAEAEFGQHCLAFGAENPRAVEGYRPHFQHGDRNDYWAENRTNATIPAHMSVSFENRVKASPSTFSYSRVPEGIPVFEYPRVADWRKSGRLLGTAARDFSIREWDCLNAELGPRKKVNLIAVGFFGNSLLAQYQEAKWFGGKKNDLVVCYGPVANGKAEWAYCFGWTESEIVKRNLETLFLDNAPNGKMIPFIKSEVLSNYRIKDWKKFDYISVEPPAWAYLVLLGTMVATQAGFWAWATLNGVDKPNRKN
jgi:hypothetical protein